jgi:hypothetical protein
MADYRVYFVGSDGHFFKAVELECTDDAEATERAQPRLLMATMLSFSRVHGREPRWPTSRTSAKTITASDDGACGASDGAGTCRYPLRRWRQLERPVSLDD